MILTELRSIPKDPKNPTRSVRMLGLTTADIVNLVTNRTLTAVNPRNGDAFMLFLGEDNDELRRVIDTIVQGAVPIEEINTLDATTEGGDKIH